MELTYLEKTAMEAVNMYCNSPCYGKGLEVPFERINSMLNECRRLYPSQRIPTLDGKWCLTGIDEGIEPYLDLLDRDTDIAKAEKIIKACASGRYHEEFNGLDTDILCKISTMLTECPDPAKEQEYLSVGEILTLNHNQLYCIAEEIENYSALYPDINFDYADKGHDGYLQCYIKKGENEYFLPLFCNGKEFFTEEMIKEDIGMER